MNIAKLKKEIIKNPQYISLILEKLGCSSIRNIGKEYRCGKGEHISPTGISVNKDSLLIMVRSNSINISGDLITLVQEFEKISFKESIQFICKAIGKAYVSFEKEENITLPFGGYYNGLKGGDSYKELETYDESILDRFTNLPSKMFLKDGIDLETQNYFKVMYDEMTNRISVPWRNSVGDIVGIMGRYNGSAEYCKNNGLSKWLPIIRFPKSQTLFGFYENYNTIVDKKTIFLGESEKFPMQLRSMKSPNVDMETGEILGYNGINLGLAVGNHSVSNYQCNLIQSCYPNNVIIAFDEGLNLQDIKNEAIKVKERLKYVDCNVGFIWDEHNKYLPKGSKASPSDFGLDVFNKLVNECIVYV